MALRLPASTVEKLINSDRGDLQSAAYNLLQQWRNIPERNSRIAFQYLSEALKRSGMNYLLDVLQHGSEFSESRVRDVRPPAKSVKQPGMFQG